MERGLARVLVGTEEVPLPCDTLLLDVEVGAINCHKTIVSNVIVEMALKIYLLFCVRQQMMQQSDGTVGEGVMGHANIPRDHSPAW